MGAVMLGLAATSPALPAPAVPGAALAQITLEPNSSGSVTIVAEAIAFADIVAQAELKVERRGAAGQVVSSQSRTVDLTAGERATIARLDVSLAVGDQLTVSATISDQGTIISTATVSTGPGS